MPQRELFVLPPEELLEQHGFLDLTEEARDEVIGDLTAQASGALPWSWWERNIPAQIERVRTWGIGQGTPAADRGALVPYEKPYKLNARDVLLGISLAMSTAALGMLVFG